MSVHEALCGIVFPGRVDRSNILVVNPMPDMAVPYADPTLDFLDSLTDESKYIIVPNVPILRPHERKTGSGDSEELIVVTVDDLPAIAADMNRRVHTDAVVPVLTIGHRQQSDQGFDERKQPDVVGYVLAGGVGGHSAQATTFGPNDEPCVTAALAYKRKCWGESKEYPFRSMDFYPKTRKVTGVALLKRDPYLGLGMVAYQADGQSVEYGMSFPGATNALPSMAKERPLLYGDKKSWLRRNASWLAPAAAGTALAAGGAYLGRRALQGRPSGRPARPQSAPQQHVDHPFGTYPLDNFPAATVDLPKQRVADSRQVAKSIRSQKTTGTPSAPEGHRPGVRIVHTPGERGGGPVKRVQAIRYAAASASHYDDKRTWLQRNRGWLGEVAGLAAHMAVGMALDKAGAPVRHQGKKGPKTYAVPALPKVPKVQVAPPPPDSDEPEKPSFGDKIGTLAGKFIRSPLVPGGFAVNKIANSKWGKENRELVDPIVRGGAGAVGGFIGGALGTAVMPGVGTFGGRMAGGEMGNKWADAAMGNAGDEEPVLYADRDTYLRRHAKSLGTLAGSTLGGLAGTVGGYYGGRAMGLSPEMSSLGGATLGTAGGAVAGNMMAGRRRKKPGPKKYAAPALYIDPAQADEQAPEGGNPYGTKQSWLSRNKDWLGPVLGTTAAIGGSLALGKFGGKALGELGGKAGAAKPTVTAKSTTNVLPAGKATVTATPRPIPTVRPVGGVTSDHFGGKIPTGKFEGIYGERPPVSLIGPSPKGKLPARNNARPISPMLGGEGAAGESPFKKLLDLPTKPVAAARVPAGGGVQGPWLTRPGYAGDPPVSSQHDFSPLFYQAADASVPYGIGSTLTDIGGGIMSAPGVAMNKLGSLAIGANLKGLTNKIKSNPLVEVGGELLGGIGGGKPEKPTVSQYRRNAMPARQYAEDEDVRDDEDDREDEEDAPEGHDDFARHFEYALRSHPATRYMCRKYAEEMDGDEEEDERAEEEGDEEDDPTPRMPEPGEQNAAGDRPKKKSWLRRNAGNIAAGVGAAGLAAGGGYLAHRGLTRTAAGRGLREHFAGSQVPASSSANMRALQSSRVGRAAAQVAERGGELTRAGVSRVQAGMSRVQAGASRAKQAGLQAADWADRKAGRKLGSVRARAANLISAPVEGSTSTLQGDGVPLAYQAALATLQQQNAALRSQLSNVGHTVQHLAQKTAHKECEVIVYHLALEGIKPLGDPQAQVQLAQALASMNERDRNAKVEEIRRFWEKDETVAYAARGAPVGPSFPVYGGHAESSREEFGDRELDAALQYMRSPAGRGKSWDECQQYAMNGGVVQG